MHRLSLIVGAWRCRRYHSAWGRACRQRGKTFLALTRELENIGRPSPTLSDIGTPGKWTRWGIRSHCARYWPGHHLLLTPEEAAQVLDLANHTQLALLVHDARLD